MNLQFGNTPVPFTASWSAEESFHVARCPHADAPAICQEVAIGEGKPQFGKPHSDRQRQVIADGLCDLCGKTLDARTKVSLSHARVRHNGAEGPAIMQVEPLLHRECAAISLRFCPSLKRDVAAGEVRIRQVTRYRVQFAIMDEVYVESLTGQRCKAIGHAKVELLAWRDRDAAWLESRAQHAAASPSRAATARKAATTPASGPGTSSNRTHP